MSLISINNLSFHYENNADNIFENVSFQIDSDWKLGFIGRNGRGKTTFLNLLLGKYEYRGTIDYSVNFDCFPFEVKDKKKLTMDIIQDIIPNIQEWMLYKEFNFLELEHNCLERCFDTLSNGEQSKVLLATLFLKENNFLLIDEPTNHLDAHARKIVSDYLNKKKGFILVSHDRTFLDNCIDHVLSINKTNIELQKGNFSSWFINKQRQDNFELTQNEVLKNNIDKMKIAAKQKAVWSDKAEKEKYGNGPCDKGFLGAKAARIMKTAKRIEQRQNNAIEEKEKLLKNIEKIQELKISPLKYHTNKLIDVKGLTIFYDDNVILKGVDFEINNSDRIALIGKNGSGKSSIIKLLLKNKISFNGTVNVASNLIISYVPQDTSFLFGNLKDFALLNNIDESLFKAILIKFDFSRNQFDKNIQDFSSGQKKKVLIAKSLCEKADLYIWDEPLNYIDIFSRIQIEELIKTYKPTLLFVEHDQTFINDIATKKIII